MGWKGKGWDGTGEGRREGMGRGNERRGWNGRKRRVTKVTPSKNPRYPPLSFSQCIPKCALPALVLASPMHFPIFTSLLRLFSPIFASSKHILLN